MAYRYSFLCFMYGVIISCGLCILLAIQGPDVLGYFVSKHETVNIIFKNFLPISIFIVLQASSGIMIGAIKGLGMQYMAVLWAFIAYYLLGLPLAAFFASEAHGLVHWLNIDFLKNIKGLGGLFFGINIALLIMNINFLQILRGSDWEEFSRGQFEHKQPRI